MTNTFEVTLGSDIHEYGTRAEAIVAARQLSTEHRGVVSIIDTSQRERMTYQHGELVTYDYETRRPLPRRQ